jgi:hypothetical protein
MKFVVAVAVILIAASAEASAEPVLMLNEPRDVISAESSCLVAGMQTASGGVVDVDVNAACKVSGPVAEVRAFHSKLLAQFASNAQCAIRIMRLGDEKSDKEISNNLEALKSANWELNLGFRPGSSKQQWALWPYQSGMPTGTVLEGEGDPAQITRDVCTIITRRGAKILN